MGPLCTLREIKRNSVKTLKNLTYTETSLWSRRICDALFNAFWTELVKKRCLSGWLVWHGFEEAIVLFDRCGERKRSCFCGS